VTFVRWTSHLAAPLATGLVISSAWADHGGALRSEGWSPLTSALVFGGLALLAGAVVIIVVAILTRRNHPSE
jgi:ABC-type Fe3+ transport system permease subunit